MLKFTLLLSFKHQQFLLGQQKKLEKDKHSLFSLRGGFSLSKVVSSAASLSWMALKLSGIPLDSNDEPLIDRNGYSTSEGVLNWSRINDGPTNMFITESRISANRLSTMPLRARAVPGKEQIFLYWIKSVLVKHCGVIKLAQQLLWKAKWDILSLSYQNIWTTDLLTILQKSLDRAVSLYIFMLNVPKSLSIQILS